MKFEFVLFAWQGFVPECRPFKCWPRMWTLNQLGSLRLVHGTRWLASSYWLLRFAFCKARVTKSENFLDSRAA